MFKRVVARPLVECTESRPPGQEVWSLSEALCRAQAPEKDLRLVVEDGCDGEEIFRALPLLAAAPLIFLYAPGREDRAVRALAAGARHVLPLGDPHAQTPLLEALFQREKPGAEFDVAAFRRLSREQELDQVLTDARTGDLPVSYAKPAFECVPGYPLADVFPDLTRREDLLEVLRAADERHRLVVEQSQSILYALSLEGNLLFVSPSWTWTIGHEIHEVIDHPYQEFVDERDHARCAEYMRTLLDGGEQSDSVEYRIRQKNGEIRWHRSVIRAVRSAEGQALSLVGNALDITEERQARWELQRSEARFRLLLEDLPTGVLVAEVSSGEFLYANAEMCRMLGYSSRQLLGRSIADLHPADHIGRVRVFFEQMAGGALDCAQDVPVVKKNGDIFPADIRGVHMELDGQPCLIGLFTDISERKENEKALLEAKRRTEESEALLKQAQNIAKVGYWIYEPAANELVWSPEVYEIFGAEPKKRGTESYESFLAYVHPDDLQAVKDAFDRHIRLREPYEITHRILTADGREKYVQERCETEYDETGAPRRTVGVVADISEVKRAQEELQRLFDTMAQGVVYQDEAGRIFRANPAARRLLGLSQDQLEGRTSMDPAWHAIRADASPFPGEEHPAMLALRTGKPVSNVVMGVFHPGRQDYVWLLVSAEPQFRTGQDRPFQVFSSFTDITGQKRTADALRESHEIFEQVGVIARIGSWDLNFITNKIQMSPVSREIHELEACTVPDMEEGIRFYKEGESRTAIRRAAEECRTHGGGFDLELEFTGAKGTPRWVRATGRAVMTQGVCTRMIGTIQDITRQKMAFEELSRQTRLQEMLMKISATYINLPLERLEEAIQQSLEELGRFVEADRFYVFSYDFIRNSCCNTHEWCAEGIDPMIQDLHHTSLDGLQDWIETHRSGEVMNVPDVLALPPDHRLRHILEPQGIKSIITMPLMDQGTCIGFIGLDSVRKHHFYSEVEQKLLRVFSEMLVNVRNRLESLNALRENRQFLSQIIENSGSLIYTKDRNGAYLSANRRWCEVTGCPMERALGRTDRELFPEEVAGPFMQNDQTAMERDLPLEVEETFVGAEGVRYFLTVKFAIRDHEGHVTGVAGMSTDITERRKAGEDRIAREAAEAENQAKSAFLAKITHEIRTPMNAIIGFANLLEREPGLSDTQRRQIQNISRSGEHLLVMINEILDLSKMEAGRMHVVLQDFNPRELVLDLAAMFEYRATVKGLKFRVEPLESLPRTLRSDPAKIRQIMTNLLGNAIKFTAGGEVSLRLAMSRRPPGPERRDFLVFEVTDSGPGITEEDSQRIYDVFYQGRAGQEIGGTGLGLSITRNLVDLLGGEIRLRSEVGVGSTFTVSLPAEISPEQYTPWRPAPLRVSGVFSAREPYRVLLLERKTELFEICGDVLEPAGFRVRAVSTSGAVPEAFADFRPDVVLVNMQQSLLEDLSDIASLKSEPAALGVPFIALSPHDAGPDAYPELSSLIRANLHLPILPESLFAVLQEVLGIEYVYQSVPERPLDAVMRAELDAAPAAQPLSSESVQRLREAVECGNMRDFEKELLSLEPGSPGRVAVLRRLAATYEYSAILKLLEQESPS